MAFTTFFLIVTVMVITADAQFGRVYNHGFPEPQMPQNPFPYDYNPFNIHIPAPKMPSFPNFIQPKFPTEQDILNTHPKKGQTYNGVYVSSIGGKGKLGYNINGHVFSKEFDQPQKSEGSKQK